MFHQLQQMQKAASHHPGKSERSRLLLGPDDK